MTSWLHRRFLIRTPIKSISSTLRFGDCVDGSWLVMLCDQHDVHLSSRRDTHESAGVSSSKRGGVISVASTRISARSAHDKMHVAVVSLQATCAC